MKAFISNNLEKVLLISLLFTLAICSVYQILSMGTGDIKKLPSDKYGSMVADTKIPSIEGAKVSLNEKSNKPYDSHGYIYCRKSDCKYIIIDSKTKCPWCSTPTTEPGDEPEIRGDTDKDGIPDEVEIKFNLKPDDPSDALTDLDGDGFRNIDEHLMKTAIDKADDHPAVIHRSKLKYPKNTYYPITVSSIDTGKYDPKNKGELHKGTWDIQADIHLKKRNSSKYYSRSAFYRINDYEKANGYTVTDVGIEGDKPYAIFQKGEEKPIKIFPGKKRLIKSTYYLFYNELNKKTTRAYMDKEFFLEDKMAKKERYKLVSYNSKEKTVIVINYMESKKPTIGTKAALEAPADPDKEGPSDLEDPLSRELDL